MIDLVASAGPGSMLGLSAPTPDLELAGARPETGFAELLQQEQLSLTGDRANEDPDAYRARQEKKLREAATDMEALLVSQMFAVMRKSVPKSEFFNGGYGEEVFASMLDDEYAKGLAQTGDLGLADQIYKQMSGYLI